MNNEGTIYSKHTKLEEGLTYSSALTDQERQFLDANFGYPNLNSIFEISAYTYSIYK